MSDDESVATKSIANPNGNDQDLDVFEKGLETADDPPMTQEILDPNGVLDDLAGGTYKTWLELKHESDTPGALIRVPWTYKPGQPEEGHFSIGRSQSQDATLHDAALGSTQVVSGAHATIRSVRSGFVLYALGTAGIRVRRSDPRAHGIYKSFVLLPVDGQVKRDGAIDHLQLRPGDILEFGIDLSNGGTEPYTGLQYSLRWPIISPSAWSDNDRARRRSRAQEREAQAEEAAMAAADALSPPSQAEDPAVGNHVNGFVAFAQHGVIGLTEIRQESKFIERAHGLLWCV